MNTKKQDECDSLPFPKVGNYSLRVVANGCNRVIGFNAIWSESGCGFKPNSYSYTGLGYDLVRIKLYKGVKRSNVHPKLHF